MRLVFLSLLFLTAPAWAADGDAVENGSSSAGSRVTIKLCDGNPGGATKTCEDHRVNVASFCALSFESSTGCTGTPTVTLQGKYVSGGTVYDLTNALTVGNSEEENPWRFPIATASIAGATGCTDLEAFLSCTTRK